MPIDQTRPFFFALHQTRTHTRGLALVLSGLVIKSLCNVEGEPRGSRFTSPFTPASFVKSASLHSRLYITFEGIYSGVFLAV